MIRLLPACVKLHYLDGDASVYCSMQQRVVGFRSEAFAPSRLNIQAPATAGRVARLNASPSSTGPAVEGSLVLGTDQG